MKTKGKDLFVYVSKVTKDPNDENNQGKYINVRCRILICFVAELCAYKGDK